MWVLFGLSNFEHFHCGNCLCTWPQAHQLFHLNDDAHIEISSQNKIKRNHLCSVHMSLSGDALFLHTTFLIFPQPILQAPSAESTWASPERYLRLAEKHFLTASWKKGRQHFSFWWHYVAVQMGDKMKGKKHEVSVWCWAHRSRESQLKPPGGSIHPTLREGSHQINVVITFILWRFPYPPGMRGHWVMWWV